MEIRLTGRKFELLLTPEDKKDLGKPICSSCHKPLKIPFYVCETTRRWFCSDCALTSCEKHFQEEHSHFCIKKVIETER